MARFAPGNGVSNSHPLLRLLGAFQHPGAATMSEPATNPIPQGFQTLSAYLICKNAGAAIEFYKKAFGAEEQLRLNGPDGSVVHCCLRVGDSPLMVADECPQMGAFSPQ